MERGSGGTARCRSPWGAQVPRAAVGGAPTRPGPVPRRGGAARHEGAGGAAWLGRAGLGWRRVSPRKPRAGRERRRGASPGPLLPPRRRREAPARALPAVPIAPAVPTGTTSAAEPRASRRLRLSWPGTEEGQTSPPPQPQPQPGRRRRRPGEVERGRRGRDGPGAPAGDRQQRSGAA